MESWTDLEWKIEEKNKNRYHLLIKKLIYSYEKYVCIVVHWIFHV